jgi:cysteine-rich repeat protein
MCDGEGDAASSCTKIEDVKADICTGHSLGGALAMRYADKMKGCRSVITYGAPRYTADDKSLWLDVPSINVINTAVTKGCCRYNWFGKCVSKPGRVFYPDPITTSGHQTQQEIDSGIPNSFAYPYAIGSGASDPRDPTCQNMQVNNLLFVKMEMAKLHKLGSYRTNFLWSTNPLHVKRREYPLNLMDLFGPHGLNDYGNNEPRPPPTPVELPSRLVCTKDAVRDITNCSGLDLSKYSGDIICRDYRSCQGFVIGSFDIQPKSITCSAKNACYGAKIYGSPTCSASQEACRYATIYVGSCTGIGCPGCGNGLLDNGEECDDGNTTDDNNGCSGHCKLLPWGSGMTLTCDRYSDYAKHGNCSQLYLSSFIGDLVCRDPFSCSRLVIGSLLHQPQSVACPALNSCSVSKVFFCVFGFLF